MRVVIADAELGELVEAGEDFVRAGVDTREHADRPAVLRFDVQHAARIDGVYLVDAVHECVAAHLDMEVAVGIGLLQKLDRVVVRHHADLHRGLGALAHVFDPAAGRLDQCRRRGNGREVEDRPKARPVGGDARIGRKSGRQQREVGRDKPRNRLKSADLANHREGLFEAVEAREEPAPVLQGLGDHCRPGDDARGAVVVHVGLCGLTCDVYERGVRHGMNNVESSNESLAVGAVLDRSGAAGTSGEETAERGVGSRGVHQNLLAGRVRRQLERGHRRTGFRSDESVSDLDDGAGPRHVEHQAPRHRDGLPVVSGAPTARGDRDAVAHGRRDGGGDQLRARRVRHQLGKTEGQLLLDHGREVGAVRGGPLACGEFDAHAAVAEEFAQLGLECRDGGVVHHRSFGSHVTAVPSTGDIDRPVDDPRIGQNPIDVSRNSFVKRSVAFSPLFGAEPVAVNSGVSMSMTFCTRVSSMSPT